MFAESLLQQATELLTLYRSKGLRIVTAESCTGGLIAALLTEIPGSSDVLERGFVTYSNEAKCESLGVAPALIEQYGAVSEAVAQAMAQGALRHSQANVAIAVTGIAGPGGGTVAKPVGLVIIALAVRDVETQVERCQFNGNRSDIRLASVRRGLALLASVVH